MRGTGYALIGRWRAFFWSDVFPRFCAARETLRNLVQHRSGLRVNFVAAISCSCGHLAQDIQRREQQIYDLWCDRKTLATQFVQKIFRGMRETQKFRQLQNAGVPLDGMHHPENRLNQFSVFRMCLQLQNGLLHLRQTFAGLYQKAVQDDVAGDFHLSFLSACK